MIKHITEEIYLDLAQNGARVLFEVESYRFLDGIKDDTQSYFIIDLEDEEFYQIDLLTSYELVTMYHGDVEEDIFDEYLEEVFEQLSNNEKEEE